MNKIKDKLKVLFEKISKLKYVKYCSDKWNNLVFVKNLKEQGVYYQFLAKMWLFIVTALFISVSLVIFNNSSVDNVENPNNSVIDNPNNMDEQDKGPVELLLDEIDSLKESNTYSYIISGNITEGLEAHQNNVTISNIKLNGIDSYKFEFNGYSLGDNYNDMQGTYYVTQINGVFCVIDNNTKTIYEQTSVNFGSFYDRLMNQVAENRFDFGAFMYRDEKEIEMKTVKEDGISYEVLTRTYEIGGASEVLNTESTVPEEPKNEEIVSEEIETIIEENTENISTVEEQEELNTEEELNVGEVATINTENVKKEKIIEIIKYSKEGKTVKYVKDTETNDLCIIFKVIDGSEEIDFSQYTKVGN